MSTSLINFSGIASGIDSAALIKALLERERETRIKPLQTRIDDLTGTNESLQKLSSLLEALNGVASRFRTVNGGALAKTGTSSDESTAAISAANSAANGSYDLTVTQVAKNATYSFKSSAGTYTSSSDKISAGGAFSDNVTIKVGDPASPAETVTVNVTDYTTLNDFVTAFNSQSSKAVASIVNVGTASSPDQRIVINTSQSGTAEGTLTVSVGATLAGRAAFDQNTSDNAKNAIFSLAGIASNINRATNSVSDIIPGVTFNLRAAGTTTVTIADDADSTSSSLGEFVEAYNELVNYIKEEDAVTRESDDPDALNIFGPLAKSSLDENLLSSLRSAFSSIASGNSGSANSLADLGLSTQRDGTLKLDEDAFKKALAADAEGVRSLTEQLGEKLSAVDGTIAQFTRFNGLIDTTEQSNNSQLTSMQQQISELEKRLSAEEDMLMQRFSRLESLMGKLNSQQSTLAQLLPR